LIDRPYPKSIFFEEAVTVRKNVKIGGRSAWQLSLRNFEIGKSW